MTDATRSYFQGMYHRAVASWIRDLILVVLAACLGFARAYSAPAANPGCVLAEKEGKVEVARKGSPNWSAGGGRAPQADPGRYRSVERATFERQRPDEQPFSIGQNVRHARFGDGVVIDFEGRGLDARVQVRFASEGTKWLALQYAKLTAA